MSCYIQALVLMSCYILALVCNVLLHSGSWRLERFVISVGLTEDIRSDCGEPYNDPVEPGGHVTIPCDLQGRFVHFRKVGGFDAFYVVLCEVEVYGGKIMQHGLYLKSFKWLLYNNTHIIILVYVYMYMKYLANNRPLCTISATLPPPPPPPHSRGNTPIILHQTTSFG